MPAAISHVRHPHDHLAFHWCVLERTNFDFRSHPDDAGLGMERDGLSAVFRGAHALHRVLEHVNPAFRPPDNRHDSYQLHARCPFELSAVLY